jgi:hypothetical protein
MESTWETRDLPVLEVVVRYFDENAGMLYPQVHDLVEITGQEPMEVYRALKALEPDYVRLQEVMSGGDPNPHTVRAITSEARRAVGQWPTPEGLADRIVAALLEAAEREPDEKKRTKLRAAAETLGSFGRDLLINVAANVATKPVSF